MDLQEETTPVRTLASDYERMKLDRQPYLDKALEAAKYTIPSLLNDDSSSMKSLTTPNQSVGADGINNLSAKTTLAMLPPNQPFFKFSMDAMCIKNQAQDNGADKNQYEQDVNRGLSLTEKMLIDYNEQNGDRVCVGEAIKHDLVAGNVFLIHTPKEGLKYYPLTRYVVKRDYCGNVLKAITSETVGFNTLPEEIRDEVLAQIKLKENKEEIKDLDERELTLYTGFKRTAKSWLVHQEVEGIEIPKSKGKYPIDICPFMALRYTRIDGESYGRGLIEEYIGDISYLDTLSLAIKQASLAAAKFIMLVNPNGITKIKHLAATKNGGFALGKPDDVKALQAEKYYDLKTAREEKETLERRLYRVFLLTQAIQRDAERVTAEEIRQMVKDLEEALGNYYSIMSQEFQLAYVKIAFHHLRKEKKDALPDLIRDKNVKLTMTTGLEALGRGSDLNKWASFFDIMAKFAQSAQIVGAKTDKIAALVATSLNLDIGDVLYTDEEKAKMAEEANKQALLQKIAPNAVNKYGDMAMQQKQQEEQV